MDALHTLLEQAEAGRNQALAAFNHKRAHRDAARAQAAHLDAYRADYLQRWSAQFAQGATLEIVRCYQGFADRLETAIVQHGHTLTHAEAALAHAGEQLTAHELRVASIRKLLERREQFARQAIERQEQKADDENAMRMASSRNRQGSGSPGVPR
jgi:flagellar FliJ protein